MHIVTIIGIPYGETIEWKTPRLSSNSSARRVSDGLLVTRNLMLDQSFSEPSSPKPKHSPGSSLKVKSQEPLIVDGGGHG